jgi:predicted nuclease of restriction endonuclease-like (RecB) superfamily
MTDSGLTPPADDYAVLLATLKERIRAARLRAAVAVNQELILLYWSIGRDILGRMSAEGWGAKVVQRLAQDLTRDFPEMTGLSPRNLTYMRAFAAAYPDQRIVQQVVAQLPWGHNLRLLDSVKDPDDRLWYAQQATEHGWSRAVLVHQIESGLINRQGKAITNFSQTLPKPQSDLARELMKDPYNFDFLAIADEMSERELERGLLEHLRSLILELGKGFAFVGSQYHLEVGGQDFYLDLLFYHLRLRCFVVIDLKVDDFKPEYAGKMNFYLSAVDDLMRHPTDAPTIGMILCKGKNAVIVEYTLRDAAKPMGVADYRMSSTLPARLEGDLPTSADLAGEFPLMSLVKLRVEIEQQLRRLAASQGLTGHAAGIGPMLQELQRLGALPASAQAFQETLRTLNQAAHGVSVGPDAATEAVAAGSQFLDDLRALKIP